MNPQSSNDYYPFGSTMAGRGFSQGTYKFGFNGKEQDDEIYGDANAYDFGARVYDARIGRWLSTDPMKNMFPSFSPYSFSANNPIYYTDQAGEVVIAMSAEAYQAMEGFLKAAFTKTDGTYVMAGIFKATENAEGTFTYECVDEERFNNALTGLSEDQQALAKGVKEGMNNDYAFYVYKANNNDKKAKYLTDPDAISKAGDVTIGDAGGGSYIEDGEGKGVVLLGDPTTRVTVGQENGPAETNFKDNIPSQGSYLITINALVAHEFVGEAVGVVTGQNTLLFAIQVENIMARIVYGVDNAAQRNGNDHGTKWSERSKTTAIPMSLGGDNSTPKSNNGWKDQSNGTKSKNRR